MISASQSRRAMRAAVSTLAASAMVMLSGPAFAQKAKAGAESGDFRPQNSYRVEAHSEYWVDLNLCSNPIVVDVRGDGDTDVDFTIYDQNNRQVYQDLDLDDITTATLTPPVSNGRCLRYRLKLNNIGDVWNQVTVTTGGNTANGGTSVGSYRVESSSDYWVDLTLCHRRAHIVGHGDDDTDVDYTLYDRNNNVVAQDLALNDDMDVTINTGTNDGTCRPFRLKLHNLGNVWNQVSVQITDLD